MRGSALGALPRAEIIRSIAKIHRQEVRFVIDVRGPTKFMLKQLIPATARSSTIYTVSIGAQQTCTCRNPTCIHILYVMMRYFGVPKESDLLWKSSLSDNEVNSLLEGRIEYVPVRPARMEQKPKPKDPPKPVRQKVKRVPIGDEDVCPICYDSLTSGEIAWCSYGCGGNFHTKCVQEWIDTRLSQGNSGSCPMCRIEMNEIDTDASLQPHVHFEAPKRIQEEEMRRSTIAEIDQFLQIARQDLNNEMARLEAQQRRIAAIVETQMKAREELQQKLRQKGGKNGASPVLSIRMPEVFSSSYVSPVRRHLEPVPPRPVQPRASVPFGDFARQANAQIDRLIEISENYEAMVEQNSAHLRMIHEELHRNEEEPPLPSIVHEETRILRPEVTPIIRERVSMTVTRLAEPRGNICDAMTLTQRQLENERRMKTSLANRLAMTPANKRARVSLKPRKAGPVLQRPECMGWSS